MLKKTFRKLCHLILYFLMFCSGIIFTILVKKHSYLTICNELGIMDMVSVFVTVTFGLYLVNVVEKSQNIEAQKKEMLISLVDDFGEHLKQSIDLIIERSIDNVPINIPSMFKPLRRKAYKVKELLTDKIISEEQLCNDLYNLTTELWVMCTNGSDISNISNQDRIRIKSMDIEFLLYKIKLAIIET